MVSGLTANDGEQRRTTANNGERRRTTANDGEQRRTTANNGERRTRRNASHSPPLMGWPALRRWSKTEPLFRRLSSSAPEFVSSASGARHLAGSACRVAASWLTQISCDLACLTRRSGAIRVSADSLFRSVRPLASRRRSREPPRAHSRSAGSLSANRARAQPSRRPSREGFRRSLPRAHSQNPARRARCASLRVCQQAPSRCQARRPVSRRLRRRLLLGAFFRWVARTRASPRVHSPATPGQPRSSSNYAENVSSSPWMATLRPNFDPRSPRAHSPPHRALARTVTGPFALNQRARASRFLPSWNSPAR